MLVHSNGQRRQMQCNFRSHYNNYIYGEESQSNRVYHYWTLAKNARFKGQFVLV